jgi:NAD(P)-dependent dehydrogenase (short-subunit alcohol dehydrogenase family)
MEVNLQNRITLITGANSGLGKATALQLAAMGATVVMVCRSRERGKAAQDEIITRSGNSTVDLLLADLSSQQSIRQLVQTFTAKYDRLHLLINNAGNSFNQRALTIDGIERSFATNHLAPFLLTNLLLDTLKGSVPARIINVGTRFNTTLQFNDLQYEKRRYNGLQAYAETKLGNIMFTYELARRLYGSGVTVNCVHPGVFKSNLGSNNGEQEPWFLRVISWLGQRILPDPERAAERVLYLAVSPEVEGVSGKYFGDKREIKSPAQTYDTQSTQRLWRISAQLTGLEH